VVRFTPPLAPLIGAQIAYNITSGGGVSVFSSLLVTGLPRTGRVVALCRGPGCRFHRLVKQGRRVDLHRNVRRLRAGAVLQVRAEARGYTSKVRVFKVRSDVVGVLKRCIAPKTTRLRKGCGG
jgi:hypothetical protein